jgi:fluoride exporter
MVFYVQTKSDEKRTAIIMIARLKARFYDSHLGLPLDPDSDQEKTVRPMHTDVSHITIVAVGAFFGTLARYDIGAWIPASKNGLPVAILIINISGAFMLGLLLQILLNRGRDEGGLRMFRLMLGTGFLGAFTTYSSLANGTVLLIRSNRLELPLMYAATSIIGGIVACALGIKLATLSNKSRQGVQS